MQVTASGWRDQESSSLMIISEMLFDCFFPDLHSIAVELGQLPKHALLGRERACELGRLSQRERLTPGTSDCTTDDCGPGV